MTREQAFEIKERCDGCEHRRTINAQGDWWFHACYHKPYRGKWIVEIEKCPRTKEDAE